jgi:hypothetical protein
LSYKIEDDSLFLIYNLDEFDITCTIVFEKYDLQNIEEFLKNYLVFESQKLFRFIDVECDFENFKRLQGT